MLHWLPTFTNVLAQLLSEKAMATHSSTLAWKIPWTGEPGRLQSMGLRRVRHDWATSLTFHFHALEKEMATHSSVCSCLENPRDGGAWWAAVYGVAQSRTQLKRLSSSSSTVLGSYINKNDILWNKDIVKGPFVVEIYKKERKYYMLRLYHI